MKIAIIGMGGVGGYFGGKIAQAGRDVTFVARGEHLKAIRDHGLIVKSIKGNFTIFPAKVTEKISDLESPDLVILGNKAWQVKEVARELKHVLKPNSTVLPIQNGVLASEELQSVLEPKQAIAGLCRIFSKIEAPGVISHYGIEPEIIFGEPDNECSPRLENIRQLLSESGIKATISTDIRTELWKKLMVIGSGGLLALTRSTYGGVRENKETRELMHSLLNEINLVAGAAGAHLESGYVEKTMNYIDSYPYDSTTSLARDIWAGKPSEIEYQNGTIVMLGEKYGIEVPVNKFIYSCLLPMERRAREKQS